MYQQVLTNTTIAFKINKRINNQPSIVHTFFALSLYPNAILRILHVISV